MFEKLEYLLEESEWNFGALLRASREATKDPDDPKRKLSLDKLGPLLLMSRNTLERLELGTIPPYRFSFHELETLLSILPRIKGYLPDFLGSYAQECLTNLDEGVHEHDVQSLLKRRFGGIPLSVIVDLWTTANNAAKDLSDDALLELFDKALTIEARAARPRRIIFNNPYQNPMLTEQLAPIIAHLSTKFDFVVCSPTSAQPVMSDFDVCWAFVLVVSSGRPASEAWREQHQWASLLNIPVVGLFTDSSLFPEDGDVFYQKIVLNETKDTEKTLRKGLQQLVDLDGQIEWWKSHPNGIRSGSPRDDQAGLTGGKPLQSLGSRFAGRRDEIQQLFDLLHSDSSIRAVNIYGGETGKSALAYQVMTERQAQGDPLVYLHARMSIDEVFKAITSVLPRHVQLTVKRWFDSELNPTLRGDFLLNQLYKHHVLMLVDNIDPDLDTTTAEICNLELRRFIKEFLAQDQTARLIITSRPPVQFDSESARHIAPFHLEFGLNAADGVEMLRKLDLRSILSKTDSAVLAEIVRKVEGLPHLLLAAYSLMAATSNRISPEDLAQNDEALYQEIIEKLITEAQARFSLAAQRVMQALAVLSRPPFHIQISQQAISALLDDSPQLDAALSELLQPGYIRRNQGDNSLEIQSWDQRYYYEQIPESSPDGPARDGLERAAAQYYMSRVSDTSPDQRLPLQWNALDHWLNGKDYDSALALLDDLSADPLGRWDHDHLVQEGYFSKLVDLRDEIERGLTDSGLKAQNLCNLGRVYMNVGDYSRADDRFRKSLNLAQQLGDFRLQTLCVIGIGNCQREKQDFDAAFGAYQWALSSPSCEDDGYLRALCLNGLASVARDQGNLQAALDYVEQAITVAQPIGELRTEFIKAVCLETQARIFRYRVRAAEAQTLYQQALVIQSVLEDRRGELYVLNRLGMVSQDLGLWDEEEHCQQTALRIGSRIGDIRGRGKASERLAYLHIVIGDYKNARQYTEKALEIATSIKARRIIGYCHFRFGQVLLGSDQVGASLAEFQHARQIFNQTQNRFDRQDCLNQIGRLYLVMTPHDPGRSVQAIDEALACNVEYYNHYSLLLKAIAQLYKAQGEISAAHVNSTFAAARVAAEDILVKSPRFYTARFTRALALAGMLLSAENEPRPALERTARIASSDLYQYRTFKGEFAEAMRTFDLIYNFDQNGILDGVKSDLLRAMED